MRLLLDENLSPRLVAVLSHLFPGSAHVREVGLRGQSDQAVWEYARANGLCIVSKDNDFRQLSFLLGAPPKVIWLEVGNAGTDAIRELLAGKLIRLDAFERDPQASLLVLELNA